MAEIVWVESAQADLDEIAEYIALDDPAAAGRFVANVLRHVAKRSRHPLSGPVPPELEGGRYRQLVEPPCRVFYRMEDRTVYIVHILRFEQLLRPSPLEHEDE